MEVLDLRYNALGPPSARCLADALATSTLRELVLAGTQLGRGVALLTRALAEPDCPLTYHGHMDRESKVESESACGWTRCEELRHGDAVGSWISARTSSHRRRWPI